MNTFWLSCNGLLTALSLDCKPQSPIAGLPGAVFCTENSTLVLGTLLMLLRALTHFTSQQPSEAGSGIISVSWMRKLRL